MLAIYCSAMKKTKTFLKNSWYTFSRSGAACVRCECERHSLAIAHHINSLSRTQTCWQKFEIHIEFVAIIIIISCKQYTGDRFSVLFSRHTFLTEFNVVRVVLLVRSASHAFVLQFNNNDIAVFYSIHTASSRENRIDNKNDDELYLK